MRSYSGETMDKYNRHACDMCQVLLGLRKLKTKALGRGVLLQREDWEKACSGKLIYKQDWGSPAPAWNIQDKGDWRLQWA